MGWHGGNRKKYGKNTGRYYCCPDYCASHPSWIYHNKLRDSPRCFCGKEWSGLSSPKPPYQQSGVLQGGAGGGDPARKVLLQAPQDEFQDKANAFLKAISGLLPAGTVLPEEAKALLQPPPVVADEAVEGSADDLDLKHMRRLLASAQASHTKGYGQLQHLTERAAHHLQQHHKFLADLEAAKVLQQKHMEDISKYSQAIELRLSKPAQPADVPSGAAPGAPVAPPGGNAKDGDADGENMELDEEEAFAEADSLMVEQQSLLQAQLDAADGGFDEATKADMAKKIAAFRDRLKLHHSKVEKRKAANPSAPPHKRTIKDKAGGKSKGGVVAGSGTGSGSGG